MVVLDEDEDSDADEEKGDQDDYDGAQLDEPDDDIPRAVPTAPWAVHTVVQEDVDVRTWKPTPVAGRRLVDGVERPQPGARGFTTRHSGPPSAMKVFTSFFPPVIQASIAAATTAYVQATTTAKARKAKTTMFHDGEIMQSHNFSGSLRPCSSWVKKNYHQSPYTGTSTIETPASYCSSPPTMTSRS